MNQADELVMLGRRAYLRRRALNQAGLPTFEINRDSTLITCMCCGKSSPHTMDIGERYCSFCAVFHEEALPHVAN